MRRRTPFLLAASVLIVLAGCGGNVVKTMQRDAELRTRILDEMRSDPALVAATIDHFLADPASRAIALDKVMSNGDAMQMLMLNIARDRTRMDGILALAVQDSSMRDHVTTLVRGVQMGR